MSRRRRAVIAEPSLKSAQGHYLSYAESVDAAWEAGGVQAAILGHRAVAGTPLAARVSPVFARDFGEGLADPSVDRLHKAAAAVRALLRGPAARLFYSRAQFRGSATGAARRERLAAAALRLPMRLCVYIDRVWLPDHDRRTLNARQAKASAVAAAGLAADLRAGMAALALEAGDQVLLPTCGEVEALAVLRLLQAWPAARALSWALVFRRPLAAPAGDKRQMGGSQPARTASALRALARAPGRIKLFTDTRQLSSQYERVVGARFETLPIPHASARVRPLQDRPEIVVSYLGNARLEKGVAILPRIVEAVRAARLQRPVRFQFQSNFNVAGGEEGARAAVAALRRMAGSDLALIDSPLTREAYEAALTSTDLMLCPYDGSLYRERSSGILCESLSLGIPVLAPSGTWLESEFALESDAWIRAAQEGRTQLAYGGPALSPRRRGDEVQGSDLSSYAGRDVSLANGGADLDLPLPPAALERLIRIEFRVDDWPPEMLLTVTAELLDAAGRETSRRVYSLHVGPGGAYARTGPRVRPLFCVTVPAGTARLRISFRSSVATETLALNTLSVHLADAGPQGAVGHSFADEADAPLAALHMLTHLEHFSRAAQAFAPSYAAFHNAQGVVARLG